MVWSWTPIIRDNLYNPLKLSAPCSAINDISSSYFLSAPANVIIDISYLSLFLKYSFRQPVHFNCKMELESDYSGNY